MPTIPYSLGIPNWIEYEYMHEVNSTFSNYLEHLKRELDWTGTRTRIVCKFPVSFSVCFIKTFQVGSCCILSIHNLAVDYCIITKVRFSPRFDTLSFRKSCFCCWTTPPLLLQNSQTTQADSQININLKHHAVNISYGLKIKLILTYEYNLPNLVHKPLYIQIAINGLLHYNSVVRQTIWVKQSIPLTNRCHTWIRLIYIIYTETKRLLSFNIIADFSQPIRQQKHFPWLHQKQFYWNFIIIFLNTFCTWISWS